MIEHLLKNNETPKSFVKGEILQRAGQELSSVFYVKSGLLRSYIIDEKGKIHIYMFAAEGWIASDIQSQSFEDKTVLFIDAIEDSEVYVLDPKKIEASLKNTDEYNLQLEPLFKRIGVMQRRILALMSSSARERYESFLEIYPELPNRVPQKMIASYLGITPEALSNIRKKIVTDK